MNPDEIVTSGRIKSDDEFVTRGELKRTLTCIGCAVYLLMIGYAIGKGERRRDY